MSRRMDRVVYFFDGFNFYHSLNENHRSFLWLDFRKFAELLTPKTRILKNVVLFTAYAKWRPTSHERHKDYISALRTKDVEIIWGKFYKKTRECHLCNRSYPTHEEKQTDVNIAVNLLTWAIQDRFDEIVLGTADSDMVPALKALSSEFPHKRITLLFPLGRYSHDLANLGHKVMRTKLKTLASSQLPLEVQLPDGSVVRKPESWV